MSASIGGGDNLPAAPPAPITPAAAVAGGSTKGGVITPGDPTTPLFLFGGSATEAPAEPPAQSQICAADEPPAPTPWFSELLADAGHNIKRRKTNFKIETGDKTVTDIDVIIPLYHLISFLEKHFVWCKRCRKRLTTGHFEQSQPPFELDVFGLACGINFKCDCGAAASLRPEVVTESKTKLDSLPDGNPFQNHLNSGDFELNRRFQLGLQLCGAGMQDGTVIAGMLKLNVNPMRRRWTEIQSERRCSRKTCTLSASCLP
jgi:hypothetical protein